MLLSMTFKDKLELENMFGLRFNINAGLNLNVVTHLSNGGFPRHFTVFKFCDTSCCREKINVELRSGRVYGPDVW